MTLESANEKFQLRYPDWKIIEFNGWDGPCILEHNCGHQKKYKSLSVEYTSCPHCEKCKPEAPINWIYNIGDVIIDEHRNLTIIDRKIKHNVRQGKKLRTKYYKYKCNICGFDCGGRYVFGEYQEELWLEEYMLYNNHLGCSVCNNNSVVTGINDIATTNPKKIKFFKNPNDAYIYSNSSTKIIEAICPYCGRVKNMPIHNINELGIACVCDDGVSYPEKFMYKLLEDTGESFKYRVGKKYLTWCGTKEYDFCIETEEHGLIIIEMHGKQHYSDMKRTHSRTLEEEQENDIFKYNLAIQNGVKPENYIVIDARKSKLEYIRSSIVNSGLLQLLYIDENTVDWNACDLFASGNIIKMVCDFWENYKSEEKQILNTGELSKQLGIDQHLLLKYLRIGRNNGWCDFTEVNENRQHNKEIVINLYLKGHSIKDIEKETNITYVTIQKYLKDGDKQGLCVYKPRNYSNIGVKSKNSTQIYCVELDMAFESKKAANNFIQGNISRALDSGKIYKGYTWKRISKEEYIQWQNNHQLLEGA